MRNFLVLDLLMKTNLKISHLICIMSLALGMSKSAANEPLHELEVGVGGNIKSVAHPDHENEKLNIHIHPLWESHYVTEGRDNLPGSALASIAGEINYNDFTFIPWLATDTDNDYDELNLNAIYSTELAEHLTLYAGYNHIKAREEGVNSHDNELSLDISYAYDWDIHAMASIYHSLSLSGSFIELAITKEYAFSDLMRLELQTAAGFNSGYVSDGHNGLNNVKLAANLSYQLLNNVMLSGYASYSVAINKDAAHYSGDEHLRSLFWAGLGVSYQFN
ncbi:hypothetical protein D9T18_07825 [Pseudoalteromonas agarivorans]|uniref:Uncharacterized protein n=2 Tax=Pseudoalteromonas agarivorans TaxID=176102 RepID=A0AAD0XBQ2_9GAMM|nr:hypothetical protein D9T18_07825 [Pseudoalteromonas agarivorans]